MFGDFVLLNCFDLRPLFRLFVFMGLLHLQVLIGGFVFMVVFVCLRVVFLSLLSCFC